MSEELASLMKLCHADYVISSEKHQQSPESTPLSESFNIINVDHITENQAPISRDDRIQKSVSNIAYHKAGLLLFTSGTTGPPKGALHSIADFYAECVQIKESFNLRRSDVMLDCSGFVNWRVTLSFMLAQLISGGCIELCSKLFNQAWFWDRVKQGNIDCVTSTPRLLDGMAKQFSIMKESATETEEKKMLTGLRGIRIMLTASAICSLQLLETWRELRDGRPLVNLYGATELGITTCTGWNDTDSDVDVGRVRL